MRTTIIRAAGPAAVALALAGAVAAAPAVSQAAARQAPSATAHGNAGPVSRAGSSRGTSRPGPRAACGNPAPGQFQCYAWYQPQSALNAALSAGRRSPAPKGLSPAGIEAAYRLPISRKSHQRVAVVDAMSTPNLAADLAVYRQHYHLPPCDVASGCLRIVNQNGKASPLPRPDPYGWGIEETLDVAMVSAACPHCHILMVEAKDQSFANLATAEDTAARLGASVISNSYGAREFGGTQTFARAYRHPGHTIVVASGDLGFTAANFPANLATVTAVGGTELSRAHNARGWTERVWHQPFGAGGSGCSAYVAKPSWQHDPHCRMRTVVDVSAVASGIALYDSSLPAPAGPWLTIGGTSVAAPLIAGMYALAGNAARVTPQHLYTHASAFFDITRGNNGVLGAGGAAICGRDYLCSAKRGYDAVTGLGSPDGIGAF